MSPTNCAPRSPTSLASPSSSRQAASARSIPSSSNMQVSSPILHTRCLPAEMVDRVVDRFATFPNGSGQRGPGLGLSIVRAMVELHKGRVLIDTAPNEGTTVTCIFPVDPSKDAGETETFQLVSPPRPRSAQ